MRIYRYLSPWRHRFQKPSFSSIHSDTSTTRRRFQHSGERFSKDAFSVTVFTGTVRVDSMPNQRKTICFYSETDKRVRDLKITRVQVKGTFTVAFSIANKGPWFYSALVLSVDLLCRNLWAKHKGLCRVRKLPISPYPLDISSLLCGVFQKHSFSEVSETKGQLARTTWPEKLKPRGIMSPKD